MILKIKKYEKLRELSVGKFIYKVWWDKKITANDLVSIGGTVYIIDNLEKKEEGIYNLILTKI